MFDHGYNQRLRQQEVYQRRQAERFKEGGFPVAMASVGISRKRLYSIMKRIEVLLEDDGHNAVWLTQSCFQSYILLLLRLLRLYFFVVVSRGITLVHLTRITPSLRTVVYILKKRASSSTYNLHRYRPSNSDRAKKAAYCTLLYL